jgi:hypothetical protein
MPSPDDIARMKADLAVLEKARDTVADTSLRKVIGTWIEDAKKALAEAEGKIKKRSDSSLLWWD